MDQQIEHLNWDSDFFSARIGKATIHEDTFDAEAFAAQARRDFDLVYAFSPKMLSPEILRAANLDMVEIMVTMSKRFDGTRYQGNAFKLNNTFENSELADVYEIAEQTSVVSRFHDEAIAGPEKTRGLYRKWVDNALNGSFSDGIFVERDAGKIIGIHLVRIDAANKIGYFTMTGVNTSLKRSGIGRKLWEQSYGYFAQADVDIIKSPFSMRNLDSFNFHLKMGFDKIEEVKYVYHFRNR